MNSMKPKLVPLSQVVLVVDTVRLVSDGVEVGRDSRAAHFLHKAGIRHSFFPADKAGAAASFSGDETFLLILGQHCAGQIRDFRFVSEEDKPMNMIDDGDVFVSPESLDNDDMLVFECRSKRHPMKWFFHCLTTEKAAEKKALADEPVLPKPKKFVPPLEESDEGEAGNGRSSGELVIVPESVFKEKPSATDGDAQRLIVHVADEPTEIKRRIDVTAARSVENQVTEPTIAAGVSHEPSAQPQEKGTTEVMKDPKLLVRYLLKECCHEFGASLSQAENGERGDNSCCIFARRATIYIAKTIGLRSSEINGCGGMPTLASNVATQFGIAQEAYSDGKTDFAKKVNKVKGQIPEKWLPKLKADTGSGKASGSAVVVKDSSAADLGPKRRSYKKREPKGEKPLKSTTAETTSPLVASTMVGTAYVEMTIFVISQMEDFTPQKAAALAKAAKMTEEQLYAVIGRVGTILKGQLDDLPQMVGAAKVLIEALKK